jgi:hypothetical protein
MSTGPTCNGKLILTGLVLCCAALTNPEAKSASSARMPLSPLLSPCPVVHKLPAAIASEYSGRAACTRTVPACGASWRTPNAGAQHKTRLETRRPGHSNAHQILASLCEPEGTEISYSVCSVGSC